MTSLLWIRVAAASVVLSCRDREPPANAPAPVSREEAQPDVAAAPPAQEQPIAPLFDGPASVEDPAVDDGAVQRPAEGSDFAFD